MPTGENATDRTVPRLSLLPNHSTPLLKSLHERIISIYQKVSCLQCCHPRRIVVMSRDRATKNETLRVDHPWRSRCGQMIANRRDRAYWPG